MAKPLFLAANPVEAEIVRDYLAAHGIETDVLGNFSWGAVGEVPLAEAYPRLYLRHDADLARALDLIREYEAAGSGPVHLCRSCGESSPGSFSVCWSCGNSLDGERR